MHLIVMRTVNDTTLTTRLLANLTKQCGWFFLVRTKTESINMYASSVLIAGGKLKGFLRKSERLSCERSKSYCVGLGFCDFSYFFFLVTPFSVFSTDFLDFASSLLPFFDFGCFYVF